MSAALSNTQQAAALEAAPFPPMLDRAPVKVRARFRLWRNAIAALDAAENKRACARQWGWRLGVSVSSVFGKRAAFRQHGDIALIDKRWSAQAWSGRPELLPIATQKYLQRLADNTSAADAIRALRRQLRRWRNGDEASAIAGYKLPPMGNPPAGSSERNLSRCLIQSDRQRRFTTRIVLHVRSDGTVKLIAASKLK